MKVYKARMAEKPQPEPETKKTSKSASKDKGTAKLAGAKRTKKEAAKEDKKKASFNQNV